MSLALEKEEEDEKQNNGSSRSKNDNDAHAHDAHDDVKELCPICLNAMSSPDVCYPLLCPTASCNFNICLNCIQGMLQSEADGYQQASDGSHQVKFCVACPVCRCKYNPMAVMRDKSNNNNKSSPKSQTQKDLDQSIIDHVILLRRVYAVQMLLHVNDSELSATHLSLKYDFLQHTPDLSLQKIKDAAVLFQKYLKDVQKDGLYNNINDKEKNETARMIPELDWTKLEALMNISSQSIPITTSNSSNGSSCSNGDSKTHSPLSEKKQSQHQQHQQSQQPWRDVTLFYGVLEDVMTVSEQEFLTQLFTSGQPDLVAQAAHIVQGILSMSTQRQRQQASSQQVVASKKTTTTTTTTKKPPASHSPKKLAQLRGRFPLPKRMPLCVALPVYDPTSPSQSLLSFEPPPKNNNNNKKNHNDQHENGNSSSSNNHNNELILARVHGPAGRLGLRRGDVVTHVQGGCEAVHDRAAWNAHLQQLLQSSSSSSSTSSPTAAAAAANTENSTTLVTLVVVNADAETATALCERAIQMQRELKQW